MKQSIFEKAGKSLEKWVLVSEKLNKRDILKPIHVFYVFIVEIEWAKGRKSRFWRKKEK